MEIIGVIIAGIIIGLLGKFVAPGDKDNIPLWLTVLCGIGGVIIGWFIYTAFGGNGSSGIDWTRWIVAIICSAVLVVIASTVMGRNTGHRGVFHH
ncbi:transglycosylase [Nocardioides panacihumi]|uniref:Transglycosylase n=1 Tax=Nocardioides panacihumi TaxID=400774 RepID=A0ABN2QR36_9ACTN